MRNGIRFTTFAVISVAAGLMAVLSAFIALRLDAQRIAISPMHPTSYAQFAFIVLLLAGVAISLISCVLAGLEQMAEAVADRLTLHEAGLPIEQTPDYTARREELMRLLSNEPAISPNGYEIPDQPERYLAVELDSGDVVWAMTDDTIEGLRQQIDSSDTTRDDVDIFDLDRKQELYASFSVTITQRR